MAERDRERGPLETLSLAGLGVLALAAGRADDLADELSQRLGIDRDDVGAALSDALESWRREARRVGQHTGDAASRFAAELGIASREAVDELELRVAQLEHRLKLLERAP
jgi:polyhydroxyalkanoate synthesis regulator phasin